MDEIWEDLKREDPPSAIFGSEENVEPDTEALISPAAPEDTSHEDWLPPSPLSCSRLLFNLFAGLEAGLLNVLEAVTLAALIFSHKHLKQDTGPAVRAGWGPPEHPGQINLSLYSSFVIAIVINVFGSIYFGVGGAPCGAASRCAEPSPGGQPPSRRCLSSWRPRSPTAHTAMGSPPTRWWPPGALVVCGS